MDEIAKQVTAAAACGDRLAFAAAAQRVGSLEEARALVRSKGVVSMVERVAPAALPRLELRTADIERDNGDEPDGADGPVMFGHFAVFDEWTEIDSWFEGHFLERVAPRTFRKTMRENRAEIRSLFQHGHDPYAGDKPLGPIDDLREDDIGAYYEVPLLDAPYVRDDILPGLRAGLYGASFRFQVMREEFDEEPDPADHNPKGLPERTLKEVRLFEFGPVTFPAYSAATAAVRSEDAPSKADAAGDEHPHNGGRRSEPGTSDTERRETKPTWPQVSQEEWEELWNRRT